MKHTELLDAVVSTEATNIASVVASTATRIEVASILGRIHSDRRAARIGRNRRTVCCTRQSRFDPETS
jgi:hypothetical protein